MINYNIITSLLIIFTTQLATSEVYLERDAQNQTCHWHNANCQQPSAYGEKPFSSNSTNLRLQLESSIIYSIIDKSSKQNLNNICNKQIQQLKDAIFRKDIWAMKGK